MIDRAEVLFEVVRVLREYCDLDDREVTGGDRLQEELGLDSVQLLSLALEVENSFQIMLAESPESPPLTVDDVVDLVTLRLAERDDAERDDAESDDAESDKDV